MSKLSCNGLLTNTLKALVSISLHLYIPRATKYVVLNKFKLKLARYLMALTSINVYKENFVELTH